MRYPCTVFQNVPPPSPKGGTVPTSFAFLPLGLEKCGGGFVALRSVPFWESPHGSEEQRKEVLEKRVTRGKVRVSFMSLHTTFKVPFF